jgi:hypothetical protein
VYAKNLKLHKGVDNRIQFRFINQEEKPIDITNAEITIRVLSYDGSQVLIQKSLTPIYALTGIAEFQIMASELDNIDAQKAQYSLEIPLNGFNLPVFVDNNSGARGMMNIEDSILPKHMPSETITIPTHPTPASNTVSFTSSLITTSYNPSLTIQPYFNNFSGTVQVQGTTDPNDNNGWYSINDQLTYLNQSMPDYYLVTGFHPYIRLQVACTQGDLTNILAR